ncbi:hypothetical protein D3C78_1864790 [compost metagenome]
MEFSILRLTKSRELCGNHHVNADSHVDNERPQPPGHSGIERRLYREKVKGKPKAGACYNNNQQQASNIQRQ